MEDFEKFDLNKRTETVATDNTLPPEPEDVLRKIEDKYVCRLEEDAAAIAVYAMQAYAKQERQKAISDIEVLVEMFWRFDRNQQHLSNWHDKQDLLERLEALKK